MCKQENPPAPGIPFWLDIFKFEGLRYILIWKVGKHFLIALFAFLLCAFCLQQSPVLSGELGLSGVVTGVFRAALET